MGFNNPNFKHEMNIVSECCHAVFVKGSRKEYPTGGKTWGILYKVELCEKCGKESDAVEECGICGEIGCKNECEGGEAV